MSSNKNFLSWRSGEASNPVSVCSYRNSHWEAAESLDIPTHTWQLGATQAEDSAAALPARGPTNPGMSCPSPQLLQSLGAGLTCLSCLGQPPPPELGYSITAEDLDMERQASLQWFNRVLEDKAGKDAAQCAAERRAVLSPGLASHGFKSQYPSPASAAQVLTTDVPPQPALVLSSPDSQESFTKWLSPVLFHGMRKLCFICENGVTV